MLAVNLTLNIIFRFMGLDMRKIIEGFMTLWQNTCCFTFVCIIPIVIHIQYVSWNSIHWLLSYDRGWAEGSKEKDGWKD